MVAKRQWRPKIGGSVSAHQANKSYHFPHQFVGHSDMTGYLQVTDLVRDGNYLIWPLDIMSIPERGTRRTIIHLPIWEASWFRILLEGVGKG